MASVLKKFHYLQIHYATIPEDKNIPPMLFASIDRICILGITMKRLKKMEWMITITNTRTNYKIWYHKGIKKLWPFLHKTDKNRKKLKTTNYVHVRKDIPSMEMTDDDDNDIRIYSCILVSFEICNNSDIHLIYVCK